MSNFKRDILLALVDQFRHADPLKRAELKKKKAEEAAAGAKNTDDAETDVFEAAFAEAHKMAEAAALEEVELMAMRERGRPLTAGRLNGQTRAIPQKQDPAKGPEPGTVGAAADPNKGKPRLLLMGQRRSGKSSISNVVFHKLPATETLFLESTARIQKDTVCSFMDISVWDFPGQIDVFDDQNYDMDAIFGELGALIWVIDAQDDYLESIGRLISTILKMQQSFPSINVEVFIHKVDGLSDDYKLDIQRDITIRIQDELSDNGFENAPVTFHLTSIYNHSIFEACSKVVQKLIPNLGSLEAMLNDLARNCHFEKCYLFDSESKIYIATDSSTPDMAAYELCSDYIDVVIDIAGIYSWDRPASTIAKLEGPPWNQKLEDQMGSQFVEGCVVLNGSNQPIILREVNEHLAIVAIMREDSYNKMALVNINVEAVIRGINEFFAITMNKKYGAAAPSGSGSGSGTGTGSASASAPAPTLAPASTPVVAAEDTTAATTS